MSDLTLQNDNNFINSSPTELTLRLELYSINLWCSNLPNGKFWEWRKRGGCITSTDRNSTAFDYPAIPKIVTRDSILNTFFLKLVAAASCTWPQKGKVLGVKKKRNTKQCQPRAAWHWADSDLFVLHVCLPGPTLSQKQNHLIPNQLTTASDGGKPDINQSVFIKAGLRFSVVLILSFDPVVARPQKLKELDVKYASVCLRCSLSLSFSVWWGKHTFVSG